MNIELKEGSLLEQKEDAIVVGIFEGNFHLMRIGRSPSNISSGARNFKEWIPNRVGITPVAIFISKDLVGRATTDKTLLTFRLGSSGIPTETDKMFFKCILFFDR